MLTLQQHYVIWISGTMNENRKCYNYSHLEHLLYLIRVFGHIVHSPLYF